MRIAQKGKAHSHIVGGPRGGPTAMDIKVPVQARVGAPNALLEVIVGVCCIFDIAVATANLEMATVNLPIGDPTMTPEKGRKI